MPAANIVAVTNAIEISVHEGFGCALLADRTVTCFGPRAKDPGSSYEWLTTIEDMKLWRDAKPFTIIPPEPE